MLMAMMTRGAEGAAVVGEIGLAAVVRAVLPKVVEAVVQEGVMVRTRRAEAVPARLVEVEGRTARWRKACGSLVVEVASFRPGEVVP